MSIQDLAAEATRQYRTTQGMVTGALRQGILSGVLQGGQPLRQAALANEFGVSRIPVREALRQLEGEGLVTFQSHRGAVVSELSYEEATEIGELRVALETLAIRHAIPNMTEEDLRQAEEILDAADLEESGSEFAQLNLKFHETLYEPSEYTRLLSILRPLHSTYDRYIRIYHEVLRTKEVAQTEHRQILEHCRCKDVEAATSVLEQHIRAAVAQILVYLEKEKTAASATDGDHS